MVPLVDLLSSYGLKIRVSIPTHQLSGPLDVVSTRCDLTVLDVRVISVGLSDHQLLQWYHIRQTDAIASFKSALSSSILCQPDRWLGLVSNVTASVYNTDLTAMLK